MEEYANKLKYERALAESNRTGEAVRDIYLRLGGKIVVAYPAQEAEAPVEEKPAKKGKKQA